ncbi:hypothetical protein JOM56_013206 [Amanita muscaria]
MRACGDTSSALSRAELSKNLDVVSEPHRTELENVPPTPRGHIDNDRLSPRVWKQSTDDQMSKGLNTAESRLKFRENSNHEVLSHAADVKANTSSCGMPSQVHSDKDNPELDCRSLTPDGLKPSNHTEMESKKTHEIMRASGDTASTLLRVKHSKYSDMVPEPRNFESKSISPTPRDRIDADCRSLHVWKPSDAMFGRLQRIIVVSNNVDSMSVVKHSHLKPEAQIVPPRPTRSSQELLTQYRDLEWRSHSCMPRVREPPDKEISKLNRFYVINHNVDSPSVRKHSPSQTEALIVPLRLRRSLEELLDSYQELEWRARSKSKPYTLSARKPPDKHAGREFLRGTLERAKGGLRSISNVLWPAFDSAKCRQTRMARRLEPNG